MSYIFGKLWHLAIIWAIRKSFQWILQGVKFLLANHTRFSPTSDNDSHTFFANQYICFLQTNTITFLGKHTFLFTPICTLSFSWVLVEFCKAATEKVHSYWIFYTQPSPSLNTFSNYDHRHHHGLVRCLMKSITVTLTKDECCQNCDRALHLLWNISHLMLEVFKGLAACGLCMKLERVVTRQRNKVTAYFVTFPFFQLWIKMSGSENKGKPSQMESYYLQVLQLTNYFLGAFSVFDVYTAVQKIFCI